ncbi:MAG: sigma-54-dependent Fis family transcriptional regulator [Bacteriovoracaceae bacterium]|nr:sigma-54-dependent Fis family transcriptional regulator [Bacteriovoracaceae bacterium]
MLLSSFSEFKFYQSFRISVEEVDDLRFLVKVENQKGKGRYIEDAELKDISVSGLGFSTSKRMSVGATLDISLQFKKIHLDLTGSIVRAFSYGTSDKEIIYGVELDEEKKIYRFLENFIMSFSQDRLKECLIESALKEKYTNPSDGFEMFSLLLSLFKDITNFGDREGFIDSMLSEVVRILNAQRGSIFLINPESNELEAVAAIGVDKDELKFDYRLGIAGSVFTTGVALNIDTIRDKTRFNEYFDKKFKYQTRSIICYPIHNREDKIIGAIELLNKKNQDIFTIEDEKTMKVLALIFSAVFHQYNPMTEVSQIRRFSNPRAREYAMIGDTPHLKSLRSNIIKLKDLDSPVVIFGESGVGKYLFAKIMHYEGQRGLKPFEEIDCNTKNYEKLKNELWGEQSKLFKCQGGTIVLREVSKLPIDIQEKLVEILKNRQIPDVKFTLDVRVIVTTSVDIEKLQEEGDFDRDFFEYLNRSLVHIDSLRRREDDIPMLVDYFLRFECKKQGLLLKSFSSRAMAKLHNYNWPRNIEELRHCVERAVLYNPKAHIITELELGNNSAPLFDISDNLSMFGDIPHAGDYNISLKDRVAIVEREMILAEIKRMGGNKSHAARVMGISREALRKKLMLSRDLLDSIADELDKKVA